MATTSIDSLAGGTKTKTDPHGRDSPDWSRPNMSELRIVLLGRSGEVKSKVGNIILRREAFETQPFYFTGKQQCERARGLVDGSHVTVINTPDLLHLQISQYELEKQVELCVSLSEPGPHVLLLVLQPDTFTGKDRDRMKRILAALNDPHFEYSMVLVAKKRKTEVCIDENRDSFELFLKQCRGSYEFNNVEKVNHSQIAKFMEKITMIVKENEGRYLTCEIYQEVEPGTASMPRESTTLRVQDTERENKPLSGGEQKPQEQTLGIFKRPQKKRKKSMQQPVNMSELRIVLLGRSGEVTCKVGNVILGGDVFSVRDQCERAQTLVNGKHVAVINTPDLINLDLSDRKLFHQIETCVNLSAPGPHAFLLVLQDGQFSEGDRKRLKRILGFFSAEAFKYSVVLVTHSSAKRFLDSFYIGKDPVQKVVEKCSRRSHSFGNPEEIYASQFTDLMEKIEQMVQENGGGFLNCEIFDEPESEVFIAKETSVMRTALRRKQKPQVLLWTQEEFKVSEDLRLNLVVFGRRGAGKTSAVNAILGQKESSVDPSPSSVYESREGEVCGRLVTVVELPALCEAQLSVSTVSHLFTSLCGPGVHAFLLVIQVGSLTDEDKAEITRIKEIFGSIVADYMIVLFIHESPTAQPVLRFLQESSFIQELLKICDRRHFIFNNQNIMNNSVVPKLLEAVEEMNKTTGNCFSLDMYWEAQLKKTVRELEVKHKNELEEKNRKIRELEGNLSGRALGHEGEDQSTHCVRIVLVGKTGSGKSATGNTILQEEKFESLPSSKSVTTRCQKGLGNVAGRRVTVVDTPGLFDTSVNNEQVQLEIARCISFLAPGPHVFLLVLQIGRITQEEKETLQLIKETFGKMAERFTIVMFTRGDDLKKESIESYIQRSDRTIQNLIHDCGRRYHVINNNDMDNLTQVAELLDKIDLVVQRNGGGCYTNEMFQDAERSIKKECERILREKEGEMQREREKLKAKHEEEMEEMKRRMEEQQRTVEEERIHREKELKDKEENIRKEHEDWKKREQEEKEQREEEEKKKRKQQELKWKRKMDEIEKEKLRMKEEWKHRQEEEKKRVETEEKQRQELIQKQRREKRKFEEKLVEEKKKRDGEEQERRSQEQRGRREWEERIKEAEKEKKEILEDMKKRAEEWELRREKERLQKREEEIYRKQKEEQERREWEEKQKKIMDEFEKEKERERLKREREKEDKNRMEKDLEEKKRQLKQKEEEWEKERKEEREKRYKEDEQRREEERKRLAKLQEEFEKEREEENQRRKKEEQARREREEKERREIEEDYERKLKEMKRKYEEEAQKQAEEFNDFKEKYTREFLALSETHEKELLKLREDHHRQFALGTELHKFNRDAWQEKIKQMQEKQEKEIEELKAKYERSCMIL